MNVTTKADLVNISARIHHRQMLDRAKEAIQEQSVDDREFDSKSFCMDPAAIPEAKLFLRKMRDEFLCRFESTKGDAVFQLGIQLFSHTTEKE